MASRQIGVSWPSVIEKSLTSQIISINHFDPIHKTDSNNSFRISLMKFAPRRGRMSRLQLNDVNLCLLHAHTLELTSSLDDMFMVLFVVFEATKLQPTII